MLTAILVAHFWSFQPFPEASSELLLQQVSLPSQPITELERSCYTTIIPQCHVPLAPLSVVPPPTQALCTFQQVSIVNNETEFTH